MKKSSPLEELKLIEQETISYQTLVDNENWEELNQKTVDRQKEIERIFNSMAKPLSDESKAVVQRIITLDNDYMMQVMASKKNKQHNLIDIKSKHKAAKAYTSINEHT